MAGGARPWLGRGAWLGRCRPRGRGRPPSAGLRSLQHRSRLGLQQTVAPGRGQGGSTPPGRRHVPGDAQDALSETPLPTLRPPGHEVTALLPSHGSPRLRAAEMPSPPCFRAMPRASHGSIPDPMPLLAPRSAPGWIGPDTGVRPEMAGQWPDLAGPWTMVLAGHQPPSYCETWLKILTGAGLATLGSFVGWSLVKNYETLAGVWPGMVTDWLEFGQEW